MIHLILGSFRNFMGAYSKYKSFKLAKTRNTDWLGFIGRKAVTARKSLLQGFLIFGSFYNGRRLRPGHFNVQCAWRRTRCSTSSSLQLVELLKGAK